MALDDEWMRNAACRSIDEPEVDNLFFPRSDKYQKVDYTRAKKICKSCPVRMSCLAYSIAHGIPYGVWGGFSPHDRRVMNAGTKVKLRKIWWSRYPIVRSA